MTTHRFPPSIRVASGCPFIAEPDLSARLRPGWALAAFDGGLFSGDADGYTRCLACAA